MELFATVILSHLAYIMYRCYHLRSSISKKRSEYLFKCYTAYAGFTLILLFFVTIAYDWRTGIGKYTMLANGHCNMYPSCYNTIVLNLFVITINKFLQIIMFSAYLVYYYKFNMNVRAAQISLDYSRKLVRIAISMGATIGFSFFIFTLSVFIPQYSSVSYTSSGILLFIQQAVIMISFLCTKKIATLCKAYFSRDCNQS